MVDGYSILYSIAIVCFAPIGRITSHFAILSMPVSSGFGVSCEHSCGEIAGSRSAVWLGGRECQFDVVPVFTGALDDLGEVADFDAIAVEQAGIVTGRPSGIRHHVFERNSCFTVGLDRHIDDYPAEFAFCLSFNSY